ncbi:peptidoglycan-binding protein [Xanthomonas campestris pv. campestris]|jgi:peptidoglycan hydrolase-like protein with peptidoglycan-binding domain/predicted chitinase|uniref:Carboxpeptidase n=2 Tax=Xanthomonas campestris TaxID=339 RepID=B0RRG1_XANCB|nr:peptidoglycan-binding protein [Xanthomonas campestris]MCD0252797.1 peptidoglycan-binding protein [Xanthomonas campestris pv. campestris]MCD0275546.1 peptidoglycan-binding protein [Xanthomonas campestris pv. campestris]MCF8789493.1 peptidoglycan-binding protein [Xanthomonas campestris pv. campestris]MCF8801979.1 peptidoglycan-binding protein [Xanthomonas campestris pv. campestris]MCF8805245.1 peptidoglycan-binding protein [Xanthomonas campestris pv. campestris]
MSDGRGRSTEGFGVDRESSVRLIVKTALENGVTDPKQISYMLATAQHETRNFQAPEEDFGRSQARKLGYSGGEEFYGRGYVHLTHDYNYAKFDKLLGLNSEMVRNPDMAKQPEIAAKVLVVGMRDGLFTGKPLDRYIDNDSHDVYNARRVVNGVTPSKPWSVKAAKECEEYAGNWERRVPDLIESVKRDGVDLKHSVTSGSTSHQVSKSTDGKLEQGERGEQVKQLQGQLAQLGAVGRDGKPLKPDGDFGGNTKYAVEQFQREHGLQIDGVAGQQTQAALAKALTQAAPKQPDHTAAPAAPAQAASSPLLSDPRHPDNAMYNGAVSKLEALGERGGFANRKELEQAAGQIVFESKVSGLQRIDHVVPNKSSDGFFAVQGEMTDPAMQRVFVDRNQAQNQPLENSSRQAAEESQRQATQVQTQETASRSMSM